MRFCSMDYNKALRCDVYPSILGIKCKSSPIYNPVSSPFLPSPQQDLLICAINRHLLLVLKTILTPNQLEHNQPRTRAGHLFDGRLYYIET